MPDDPRVGVLTAAAVKVVREAKYDAHYAGVEERAYMESILFLARWDAVRGFDQIPIRGIITPDEVRGYSLPIPMILFCPSCGVQHIDTPEDHEPGCQIIVQDSPGLPCTCGVWTNPPHKSHLCYYCCHIWRPADVPTTGVLDIAKGSHDSQPVRGAIDKTVRFRPEWRHKVRGTRYRELGRGELQASIQPLTLTEGARMIAYQGEDNRVWFRTETEFDDGRYEKT